LEATLNKLIEHIATPLQWLIVAGIAWTIANSVLGLVAPSSQRQSEPSSANSASAPAQQAKNTDKAQRVETLKNRHIFGQEPQSNVANSQSIEPAEATRLPLVLNAVFIANDNDSSGAIVSNPNKKGLLYKVGDILPGNARLIEVQQEQIILQRAGNREALAFRKTKFNPIESTPQQDFTNSESTEDNITSIADIQNSIGENVTRALNDFGLETNEGRGYKVGNLTKNPFLRQAGLRTGDVVLSVNGQSLGNLQKDQLEFDNLIAQGSASIELERNGEQITITARLPN